MAVAVLSDEDKGRVRGHLGYPETVGAAAFALGFPATIETAFLIEKAMELVRPEALPRLRRILDILDSIEDQMVDDHELLAATEVGEIKIREDEQDELDDRYDRWVGRLENMLVVSRNPFDKRRNGKRGGINARVMHR